MAKRRTVSGAHVRRAPLQSSSSRSSGKRVSRPSPSSRGPKRSKKKGPKEPFSWSSVRHFWRTEWFRRWLKYGLYFGLACFAAGFLFVVGMFAWISRDLPSVEQLREARVIESTEILDRNGKLLYRLHGDENRILVDLEQVPDYLEQATVTIEDQNFYDHPGFDIKATFRSAIAHTGILSGYHQGGGSTITQQLMKNTVVGDDRTVTRKMKELILSFEIERIASKDEILGLYLNQISYGSQAYGVEAAAQRYFGKSVTDISLSEAAILASIPQASTRLSPHGTHLDQLKRRQEMALNRMAENGFITEDEAREAKEDDVLARVIPPRDSIKAPHFVFHVLEQLENEYGREALGQNGYRVTTTLDLEEQLLAEEIVSKYSAQNLEKYNANNMSLVSIDPRDGTVRAMVGSVDYFNSDIEGQVNVATSLKQPGSSFKPLVFVRSFEKGYTPDTLMMDVRTDFGGGYTPQNYSGTFNGPVTIRDALARSLNIPAVKMTYLIGVDDMKEFARRMGYENFEGEFGTGLSLGLGSREVSLLNHVGAYAVIANGGRSIGNFSRNTIMKIEQDGEVLYEYDRSVLNQLVDEQATRLLTSILSNDSIKIGAPLILDRPSVAKTGTTNDNYDAWTVGYTPQRVTGVWTGNTDRSATKGNLTGLYGAAPAWNEFMRRAHLNGPTERFSDVAMPTTDRAILNGKFETEKVNVCKSTGELATPETPETQVEEREFSNIHSLLYYVKRLDPRSPRPENPESDPQFERWESGVLGWVSGMMEKIKNGEVPEVADTGSFMPVPTEECASHKPDQIPVIQFLHLKDGLVIPTGETYHLLVDVVAPQGVRQVDYSLDGIPIGSRTEFAYDLNYIPPVGYIGEHLLRATVYDNVDNMHSIEAKVTFKDSSPVPVPVPTITPAPVPSVTPSPSPSPSPIP